MWGSMEKFGFLGVGLIFIVLEIRGLGFYYLFY